jgi:hypoxanthine phosphoribosyltransferase
MKTLKMLSLYVLLAITATAFIGCGKKGGVDTTKPISEVKAEAEKMNVQQLREIALKYKNAIAEKTKEVEKLTAKIKPTELLSNETKKIQADINNIKTSIDSLTERFKVYYNTLKEKGGDTTSL